MFENKKIFILGMARSGYEVAKLLSNYDNEIVITDKKEQDENHIKELKNRNIKFYLSDCPEELLDSSFSLVVKNPGINYEHPLIKKAEKLNIKVVNEVEVAYHFLPKGVKIIAVTGANGKTTTTTLCYEFLKKAGYPVHLGGNIGYPLSQIVSDVKENDIVVLEISAQQLHDMYDFKADVAILTNLTEVHLDFFKTYENYINHKLKIFNNQKDGDIAVINKSNKDSYEATKNIDRKVYFSSSVDADCSIKDNAIYYGKEKIINLSDIKVKGAHNYENIMCAIIATKHFGIESDAIKDVLSTFNGVEHRIEFVKDVNKRSFYNDSKATNVKSTTVALSAFDSPTILLLGGLDRGHSFDGLIPYLKNTKQIVCYGQTKDRIESFANTNNIPVIKKDTLKEAVIAAYELSTEGDTILLSPACASWDQYSDFEARGKEFKEIVNNLK